MFDPPGETGPT